MKKRWCITIKARTLLIVLLVLVTAQGIHSITEHQKETFKAPKRPAMLVQQ